MLLPTRSQEPRSILTSLNVGGDGPEEVDNVGVRAQVGHYLQLGHQRLQDVLAGEGIHGLDGHQGLILIFLYT